jgi:hypothetical protein
MLFGLSLWEVGISLVVFGISLELLSARLVRFVSRVTGFLSVAFLVGKEIFLAPFFNSLDSSSWSLFSINARFRTKNPWLFGQFDQFM